MSLYLSEPQASEVTSGSHIDTNTTNTEEAPVPASQLSAAKCESRREEGLKRHHRVHRISKPEHLRSAFSSFRHSRRRVAFPRVLASFFNSHSETPTGDTPNPGHHQVESSASSILSPQLSLRRGSTPNLELISPNGFLFSGPSLRSAYSSSMSNSVSRRASYAETGSESNNWTEIDARALGRIYSSASFSGESSSLIEVNVSEPPAGQGVGITRSMSDVLLGMDEMTPPIFEALDEDGASLTTAAPLSIAHRLPNEILQQIYSLQSPRDFNAARRTCRTWMAVSLHWQLLLTMLKRGGWERSIKRECEKKRHIGDIKTSSPEIVYDAMLLSRRLSRECALGMNWTGNGVDHPPRQTPLFPVSKTDFSDLASGYAGSKSRTCASLVMTASVCGKYLLVAQESMIYVYKLESDTLRPLTCVACPRRVLAMSMDTSANRFAVAALLDGRMGIWCNLQLGHTAPIPTSSHQQEEFLSEPSNPPGPPSSPSSCPPFQSITVQSNDHSIHLEDIQNYSSHGYSSFINQTWNLKLRNVSLISRHRSKLRNRIQQSLPPKQTPPIPLLPLGTEIVPLEPGPSTIYRELCREDDPPRSVAICPQRRAVAFGCAAGVELHWVDFLTGRSLHRWFPLPSPSDFIYFLASPIGKREDVKKLRLISSAVHPRDRPCIAKKFFSGNSAWDQTYRRAEVQRGRDEDGRGNVGVEGRRRYDHYRAVPLSDGEHVLFTDPESERLFLGRDAPLNSRTKLVREVELRVPPTLLPLLLDGGRRRAFPRLYAAATDLEWGVRVGAVYGDVVVLFSVPEALVSGLRDGDSLVDMGGEVEDWDCCLHWWDCYRRGHSHSRPESDAGSSSNDLAHPDCSFFVQGTVIGRMEGICELALYTNPDLTLWAFGLDGMARTWQIRGREGRVAKRVVTNEGHVKEAFVWDGEGNVVMGEAPPPAEMMEEDCGCGDGEEVLGMDGQVEDEGRMKRGLVIGKEGDVWYNFGA